MALDRHPAAKPSILSVGHSNHSLERFLDLVSSEGIQVIVDVRSYPASRHAPEFNRDVLPLALEGRGIQYVFLGRELGGRPEGDEFYDEDGHVLYGRVAGAGFFRAGMKRLETGAGEYRIAIMCSEEDPLHCHRRLLVARVLCQHGLEVTHVRGDGRLETEEDVNAREGNGSLQESLFDEPGADAWRSTRSVLRRRAPASSSTF